MDKDTTRKLEEKLIQIRNENDLENYLDEPEALTPYSSFADCFLSLDKVRNRETADIVRASGIERSYCYQILNGTRPHPSRDKIIRLCIAAQLSLKETNRILKTANEAMLYARNRRDAILIFAIENKQTCEETGILLDTFSEAPLE